LHLRLLAQQLAQVTARSCLRNSWTQQRPLRGRKNRLARGHCPDYFDDFENK
jgi:hypothetical protein